MEIWSEYSASNVRIVAGNTIILEPNYISNDDTLVISTASDVISITSTGASTIGLVSSAANTATSFILNNATPRTSGLILDVQDNGTSVFNLDPTGDIFSLTDDMESGVADGASAVAWDFDCRTKMTTSTAKIMQWRNGGDVFYYMREDGAEFIITPDPGGTPIRANRYVPITAVEFTTFGTADSWTSLNIASAVPALAVAVKVYVTSSASVANKLFGVSGDSAGADNRCDNTHPVVNIVERKPGIINIDASQTVYYYKDTSGGNTPANLSVKVEGYMI